MPCTTIHQNHFLKYPSAFLSLLLTLSCSGFGVFAQSPRIQTGIGAWPGAGIQLVQIHPRNIYSLEVMSSVDVELWEKRTPVFVSAGIGAALRPLGVLRVIGSANYSYDFYLGVRFGPSLSFRKNPTRQEKNRQFSLFLDPFIRYVHPLGKQTGFIEIGPQRPVVRFGLWVSLE